MDCECGAVLELDFNSKCFKCGLPYESRVEITTTTIEVEAGSEAEALSKAWGEMDNAMNITDMRIKSIPSKKG